MLSQQHFVLLTFSPSNPSSLCSLQFMFSKAKSLWSAVALGGRKACTEDSQWQLAHHVPDVQ